MKKVKPDDGPFSRTLEYFLSEIDDIPSESRIYSEDDWNILLFEGFGLTVDVHRNIRDAIRKAEAQARRAERSAILRTIENRQP